MENDGITTGNPLIDKAVAKVPPYNADRPYPVLEPLWDDTVIKRTPNEAITAVEKISPHTIYRYGSEGSQGMGTVTSVGLSTNIPWLRAVGNNPVTGSGTLELNSHFTGYGALYLNDAGTFTAPSTGSGFINVMDYGAVADDSTDNTAAFNNALAAAAGGQTVFVPPGIYVVNGDITVPAFKFLEGGGNFGTQIHVTANSQTNGLINLNMGSALRNISIRYYQPDPGPTPNFALFRHYKPAIRIDSIPHGCHIENVRISFAWDGILFDGNGGRSYLRNIEISMFNRGMDIDGPLDTVRIENYHVWPFQLTGNYTTAFYAPNHSVALYVGRCDGLHISNMMAINGQGLDVHPGETGGVANIYFTSCAFDSYSSILWAAGGAGEFDNCFFSSAQPEAQNAFVVTGGRILISNSHFFGGATGGFLQVNGGNAQLSNCRFTSVKWKETVPDFPANVLNDTPSITQSTGELQVNGSYFDRPVDTDYTTPFIDVAGGSAVICNNIVKDNGTGTGDFVSIAADSHPIIKDNLHIGWTIDWPNGAPDFISVLDYGAMADDTTDDTDAFNAAIQAAGPNGTVFVPSGTYLINGQIEMNGLGASLPGWGKGWPSVLLGAGRLLSVLHIPDTAVANQDDGTIHAAVGVTITDLGFAYDQPEDNPDYASGTPFNQYKPVIKVDLEYRIPAGVGYVAGYLGSRFSRLRIMRAWDGIETNTDGGATPGRDIYEDIEISMFNHAFIFDGHTDSTRMEKIHVFPFGLSANQIAAFHLQDHSVGLYVGKHPGIRMIDSLFINGTAVHTHRCAVAPWEGEGCNLHFTNVQFDSFCVLELAEDLPTTNGSGNFVGCAFGSDPDVSVPFVNIFQGPMRFVNCAFGFLGVGGTRDVLIENNSADPVEISNCRFPLEHLNQTAIASQGGGSVLISNCAFVRDDGVNYTAPVISVTSGKAIVTGNCCEAITTGSGPFLELTTNDYHTVSGNNAIGWDISWPATTTKIQAFGNQTGATIGTPGQNQALGVKQLVLEGGTSNNLKILSGAGSPAGAVTADPGSLYLSTSGDLYVKSTGTGNTGWSAALS